MTDAQLSKFEKFFNMGGASYGGLKNGAERSAFYRYKKKQLKNGRVPDRGKVVAHGSIPSEVVRVASDKKQASLNEKNAKKRQAKEALELDAELQEAIPNWSDLPEVNKKILRAGLISCLQLPYDTKQFNSFKLMSKVMMPAIFEDKKITTFTPNDYQKELDEMMEKAEGKKIVGLEEHEAKIIKLKQG